MLFSRSRRARWIERSVCKEVDRTRGEYEVAPGEVDLQRLTCDAFDRRIAADFTRLRQSGMDAESFYADEVAPCWEDLGPAARKAKLLQFVRVANAASSNGLGDTDLVSMIRAKTLLLAWAYDHAYGANFVERLSRSGGDFGMDELVLSRPPRRRRSEAVPAA